MRDTNRNWLASIAKGWRKRKCSSTLPKWRSKTWSLEALEARQVFAASDVYVVETVIDDIHVPSDNCDLNRDGLVDGDDARQLFEAWGSSERSPSDINQDGTVDAADAEMVFSNWTAASSDFPDVSVDDELYPENSNVATIAAFELREFSSLEPMVAQASISLPLDPGVANTIADGFANLGRSVANIAPRVFQNDLPLVAETLSDGIALAGKLAQTFQLSGGALPAWFSQVHVDPGGGVLWQAHLNRNIPLRGTQFSVEHHPEAFKYFQVGREDIAGVLAVSQGAMSISGSVFVVADTLGALTFAIGEDFSISVNVKTAGSVSGQMSIGQIDQQTLRGKLQAVVSGKLKVVDKDADAYVSLAQFRKGDVFRSDVAAKATMGLSFSFDTSVGAVNFSGDFSGSLRRGKSTYRESLELPRFDQLAKQALGSIGGQLSKFDLTRIPGVDVKLPIVDKSLLDLLGKEMAKQIGVDPTEYILNSPEQKNEAMRGLVYGKDFDLFKFKVKKSWDFEGPSLKVPYAVADVGIVSAEVGIFVETSAGPYIDVSGAFSVMKGAWVTPESGAGFRAEVDGGFYGSLTFLGQGLKASGGLVLRAVGSVYVVDSSPNDGKVFLSDVQDVGAGLNVSGGSILKGCIFKLCKSWEKDLVDVVDVYVGPPRQIVDMAQRRLAAARVAEKFGRRDPSGEEYFEKLGARQQQLATVKAREEDTRRDLRSAREDLVQSGQQLDDAERSQRRAANQLDKARDTVKSLDDQIDVMSDRIRSLKSDLASASKKDKPKIQAKIDNLLEKRAVLGDQRDTAKALRQQAAETAKAAEAAQEKARRVRNHAKKQVEDLEAALEKLKDRRHDVEAALRELLGS